MCTSLRATFPWDRAALTVGWVRELGYNVNMATEMLTPAVPILLDLSGLPAPVVKRICQLVESLKMNGTIESPIVESARKSLAGVYDHLGISISHDEFKVLQREAWSTFPRELPKTDQE